MSYTVVEYEEGTMETSLISGEFLIIPCKIPRNKKLTVITKSKSIYNKTFNVPTKDFETTFF